jgi:adenosylcobinamide kinase/adenosylcobinamide-phosphate guanylyltransferase
MRLQLLGTGSSSGWPNPWCRCASCRAAADAGVLRGQSSALLDGRVLLDVGAEAPRAALTRAGGLADVELVLVTHAHPDHHAWPAWMWRGWAAGRRPLTLVAPPAVLDDARERLDDTVTAVPVAAGERVQAAGYEVLALPAEHGPARLGPPVLYDVTAPDGGRLLWACDTGVLPEPAIELAAGRAYDVVALELTGGDLLRPGPEVEVGRQVARLRRCGAVTDRTRLLAVHLGHDNPPPAELDAVLAGWGARAPVDGEVVDSTAAPPPRPAGRRTLVLGGARSGKSAHAERLLAAEPAVTYVATAPDRPDDAEWAERVRTHAARRPVSWRTVETGDVASALRTADAALLVDDLGLWLTRLLDDAGAWDGPLPAAVDEAVDELEQAWRDVSSRAVLVAPLVGGGVVPATASGRRFRDLLGTLTARLAAGSDDVVEVVAGLARVLR